jgi:phosphoglucosamine mutase
MGKLFGTDGIRGKANIHPMTADMALRVGRAVGYNIRQNKNKKKGTSKRTPKVIIGKDTRLSCYMIEHALAAGLCSCGVDVIFTGPLPTPAISFITKQMRASAGIVISASHNSYNDNGIKIFSSEGFKLSDEEEAVLEDLILTETIDDYRPIDLEIGRGFRIDHAYGRYVTFLKQSFPAELDLTGLRVVLDCANGASYKVAPTVMEELGAEVFSYGISPNGTNINENCGALYPENLAKLVKQHRADIGIALDGDADRLILVDEHGEVVDGDKILAISAIDMIKNNELNKNTVVATLMSNMGLEEALEKHGGHLIRTNVGDRYVVEEMKKNGYNLGGEKSGHLVFSDTLFTGDGLLGALRVLSVLKKRNESLSSLASQITLYPQHMVSIMVKERVPLNECPMISEKVETVVEKLADRGRIVLRFSGTEPKIRLMMEGKNEKEIKGFMKEVEKVIRKELT